MPNPASSTRLKKPWTFRSRALCDPSNLWVFAFILAYFSKECVRERERERPEMQIISASTLFHALAALVAVCSILPTTMATTNTFAPIYNFNNGTYDATKICPSDEWSRIQIAMGNAFGGTGARRELLRSPPSNRRNLALKCSGCGGRPLCLAQIGLGCALLGKRRRLELHNERDLNTSPCSSKITAVDSALTTIKSTLSSPCQALLNAPRGIQCAEYTHDCNIVSFTAPYVPLLKPS